MSYRLSREWGASQANSGAPPAHGEPERSRELLSLTHLAVRGIGRCRQLWAEPMDAREYRGWLNPPSLFPEWDERVT
jgi:hypothetical protein